MDLLAIVSAAARTHVSALVAEAMRVVALRAAVAVLAAAALGFLAAAATVALAERIGTAEALCIIGVALAAISLVVYLVVKRREKAPRRGDVFAPAVVHQEIAIEPKLPGGLVTLALLAGTGYILAQRTSAPTPKSRTKL